MSDPGRRVMVVAGGEWQLPLLHAAKRLGYFVVNTDWGLAAPGFAIADAHSTTDVTDREGTLEVARRFNIQSAVTDQSDIAVPTVAYVCETLGLPGIGVDVAERFTDKSIMRDAARVAGIPQPLHALAADSEEMTRLGERWGWPVVVKPADSQSSRGVTVVETSSEAGRAFDEALKQSAKGRVVVEEYIDGTEFTVEGFKSSEGHRSLAVSRKDHFADRPTVASRLVYSHRSDDFDYDVLREQNDRLVDSMELPFGITHAEYKYRNGNFYLIEIAARGGGTHISSHVVPAMSGVDVQGLLLRAITGDAVGPITPAPFGGYVMLDFFQVQPGKVAGIHGFDAVCRRNDVIDAGLNIEVGGIVSPPHDDRSRHGHFIVTAPSETALELAAEEIHATLRVDND